MAGAPSYPLYNCTWHLYRLSPLHYGETPLLNERALKAHAKRLKEQLKGDLVRGVQVDFVSTEDTVRLGNLEQCHWDLLGDENAWVDSYEQIRNPDGSQSVLTTSPDRLRGIQVSLEYEKHVYNALLLRDPGVTTSPDGFTSLPLLLVKMPGSIREIFLNYLKTAFDTHIATLKLTSSFIISSTETFFKHLTATSSTQTIQNVIRQLHIRLSFPAATTLLRSLDVTIAGADVSGFLDKGKSWNRNSNRPFTSALSVYLNQHLALDMAHAQVEISRISSNSFHIGTERLKLSPGIPTMDNSIIDSSMGLSQDDLSASQLAVRDLYASLVNEATGTGRFLPENLRDSAREETPSSTTSTQTRIRKRTISNVALGHNTQKKARAKRKENGHGVHGGDDMTV